MSDTETIIPTDEGTPKERIRKLLGWAKREIYTGECSFRSAAGNIAKAIALGATQTQAAKAVGKSQAYISQLLKWHEGSYKETSPFADAHAKAKAKAAAKLLAANNPPEQDKPKTKYWGGVMVKVSEQTEPMARYAPEKVTECAKGIPLGTVTRGNVVKFEPEPSKPAEPETVDVDSQMLIAIEALTEIIEDIRGGKTSRQTIARVLREIADQIEATEEVA